MYKDIHFVSADEAVKVVKSGDHIHFSSVASAPQILIQALCRRGDAGELQDLDVMNNRLYLFFNTGEILCYTIENGTLLYRKAAYTESERHLYNKTSLVVKGNGGIFYQLRYGSRS